VSSEFTWFVYAVARFDGCIVISQSGRWNVERGWRALERRVHVNFYQNIIGLIYFSLAFVLMSGLETRTACVESPIANWVWGWAATSHLWLMIFISVWLTHPNLFYFILFSVLLFYEKWVCWLALPSNWNWSWNPESERERERERERRLKRVETSPKAKSKYKQCITCKPPQSTSRNVVVFA